VESQSSQGSTTARLSQAPTEHVDVDRGACEESGAKGQFSEHTQGGTHVRTVAEEPNLEALGSTAVALVTESNTLSFRWAMGGRVYTQIGDGYYYDLEGVRYCRSGERRASTLMSKSPQSLRQTTIVCPFQQWTPWFPRQSII
jgi:hypothetical protein